jgi:hypothetical protein
LSESQGTAILSITDYQGFDDVTFEVSIYRSDDSLFGFIPNLKDYFQISSTLNLPDLDTEIYRFEVAPIPEPCTAALAGLAAAVLIGIRKTKKFC